jgi:hypothetical protein
MSESQTHEDFVVALVEADAVADNNVATVAVEVADELGGAADVEDLGAVAAAALDGVVRTVGVATFHLKKAEGY